MSHGQVQNVVPTKPSAISPRPTNRYVVEAVPPRTAGPYQRGLFFGLCLRAGRSSYRLPDFFVRPLDFGMALRMVRDESKAGDRGGLDGLSRERQRMIRAGRVPIDLVVPVR